jgi:hypothetical protein
VWVGGVEVNDSYLAQRDAYDLALDYLRDGYDDVIVENTKDRDSDGNIHGTTRR